MVKINGKVVYSGNVTGNMSIVNGEVRINGQLVEGDKDAKTINIEVTGDVGDLDVDYCQYLNVHSANEISTSSGDVSVGGSVSGNVTTSSGDVEVGGNVSGKVKTSSGDVTANKIEGGARTTSGDISGS
jgi:hypothetical protein